ncbi:MAG: MBL fold metallo-hydrolase [Clostridia bacterium]|nr:MBL fold metallo-hydrolase [Clostridia bacterium]
MNIYVEVSGLMKVISLSPVAWESNSYLLVHGDKALLVDAGAPTERIAKALAHEGATLEAVLLTHGHFDHILSIDDLRAKYGVPVYVHRTDAPMLTDGRKNAYAYFFRRERVWRAADRLLSDGDTISFGDKTVRVLHTPGHTEGSICFCVDELLFSGDTVFADGYGRTDLEGGSYEALTRSLGTLFALPEHLTVYPGHGMTATLEQVKRNLGF